jgi:acylpyruvate hydrolase
VGVGKNYALHIKEMGGQAPKDPVLFLKPTTSYVHEGSPIIVPKRAMPVHHEVELALVIGQLTKKVPQERALKHIGGYALAIDLTARKLQDAAKKVSASQAGSPVLLRYTASFMLACIAQAGLPWSVAKGWDGFCPISRVLPTSAIPNPDKVDLWLKINGATRQHSNTSNMIHNCAFLISYISHIFTLEPGDVILTGE